LTLNNYFHVVAQVNFWEMVRSTDPIPVAVMVVLLMFSLLSWTVIFSKGSLFRRAQRANQDFLRAFRKGERLDAIAAAGQLPWVDSKRIYLYGHSRGAVVAAVMIGELTGVEGAVLRSGAYDLPNLYQKTSSWWLKKLLNPKGEANPKLFNVLDDIPVWKTSTLILHGEEDSIIPPSQALLLHDRLQAAGKTHRLVLFPDRGHWLPLSVTKEQTLAFLAERSGWSCPASDR